MAVKHVLKPDSIAFVGATERAGWGATTCKNLLRSKNADRIYFISKREEVFGKKCYKTLSELPEAVDLVIISVPRAVVNDIMREAGELGVKGAIIYTSGYTEENSAEADQIHTELKEICDQYGITVCGPNCAGVLNFVDNIFSYGITLYVTERKGGIAILSQSGQFVALPTDQAYTNYSYCISCGNSSITNIFDFLDFLVDDPDTKVICMYLEGVKEDPEKMIATFKKAQEKKKPIIMLKNGKSPRSTEIARYHTGSFAGNYKIYEKIFNKYGIISVDDVNEFINMGILIDTLKELPKGNRYTLVGSSGGEAGTGADNGLKNGLVFPDFSPEIKKELEDLIPSFGTVNNPLDATGDIFFDGANYVEVLQAMNDDPNIDAIITAATYLEHEADYSEFRNVIPGLTKAVAGREHFKPMMVIPFVECGRDPRVRAGLREINVPLMPTGATAFKLLGYLSKFVMHQEGDDEITEEELSALVKK